MLADTARVAGLEEFHNLYLLQLAILIFVENQLAILLINKPDHKLTKPVGYHIDLSVVALLSGLSGLIGIPFLCGASVRSIQHLQALSVFTKKHAPGEKPRLVKIHEQRITNIVVHALIGEGGGGRGLGSSL